MAKPNEVRRVRKHESEDAEDAGMRKMMQEDNARAKAEKAAREEESARQVALIRANLESWKNLGCSSLVDSFEANRDNGAW